MSEKCNEEGEGESASNKRRKRECGVSKRTLRRRRVDNLTMWAGDAECSLTDDQRCVSPDSQVASLDELVSSQEVYGFDIFSLNGEETVSHEHEVDSVIGTSSHSVVDSFGEVMIECTDFGSKSEDEWYEALDFGTLAFDCETCWFCRCAHCGTCQHVDEGECVHCDKCLCDSLSDTDVDCDNVATSDDEVIESVEDKRDKDIKNDFIQIVLNRNINQSTVDDLLHLYRKYDFGNFPKCAKTLLKTPISIPLRPVPPGQYWHRGISKDLVQFVTETKCSVVRITFNVDGVPLSSSSGSCFWPILCSFNNSNHVIMAGAYHGTEKPVDSNDFMEEFLQEVDALIKNGIEVQGKDVQVSLYCVVCDAPAKAFLLKIKNHNGYFSCPKCTVEGEMSCRRMFFHEDSAPLRTDESFKSRAQEEHHRGKSSLEEITDFGPVSCVPFDYMHLVLLGIMRKIMYMWLGGPLSVRLPGRVVNLLSQALVSLVSWVPKEFVRKPRSIQYVKRFKATEFRQILFYTGPVVLLGVLPQNVYEHFLVLHVAMTLLASPMYCTTHLNYAHSLLSYWVATFKVIYGQQYISHNVHGLLHLAQDVAKYGPVDSFSAFKFENFLQSVIKMVRKGDKPLQQLARRYAEAEKVNIPSKHPTGQSSQEDRFTGRHMNGPIPAGCTNPQYSSFSLQPSRFSQVSTSEANNCCLLNDGSCIVVKNFIYCTVKKTMVVVGRKFRLSSDLYEVPCKSSMLSIYYVSDPAGLQTWPVESISRKCYRMPHRSGFAVFPLLHFDHSE